MRGLLIGRLWIGCAVAVCTLSGVAAYQHARSGIEIAGAGGPGSAVWREIAWPFPRDGWPAGRAFRCGVDSCGGEVELYVRPKIGFCNCDSCVADDDEVDRVADLDLMSQRFVPLAIGEVVRIDGMSGRSRAYHLDMSDGSARAAVGFALSRRCDLLVAVAQGSGSADHVEHAARAFLDSDAMGRWMVAAMDGR
jgi:hypothetical protein